MEKATIIAIGDELLIGQVTDTNSGFIERELNKIGIEVVETMIVHDSSEQIKACLAQALNLSDVVMLTGGLGPTKDDITKNTLCEFFNTRLVVDEQVHQHVVQLYSNRPSVLNSLTETQWLVPENCTILTNRIGSAPIMWFKKDGKYVFSMPGVPSEMQVAITEQILPVLKNESTNSAIQHFTMLLSGIPESALALKIADWEDSLPQNLHLAYLPAYHTIRLRLSGKATDDKSLLAQMNHYWQLLLPQIQEFVVSLTDEPIEKTIGRLLSQHQLTIATAESCTGGKIAMLLNKHAGSSAFYNGSVVAYSNQVKNEVLGVNKQDLEQYGAVSEQVVRQMAEGVKQLMNTDFALATSGVAGPDGGTKEKPVGTVWIAIATPTETIAECLNIKGTREQITSTATQLVLVRLAKYLNARYQNSLNNKFAETNY